MAYYFMVETKKGQYQELNINNSKYYPNKTKKYKKPCAYTLEEIDYFTIMFNDEQELRKALYEEGILNYNNFNKPLSVRYKVKDKFTKVPYDFLYQDSIEYIMQPEEIITEILRRYYDDDYMLINKIASTFNNFRRCSSTSPEVRQYIQETIRTGQKNKYLETIDENGDRLISRLLKLIILDSYDDYKTGKVIYKDKINYRNLHVLIALINNYDKKNKQEIKEKHEVKQEENGYNFAKKLGSKKYNLDEQISFDI